MAAQPIQDAPLSTPSRWRPEQGTWQPVPSHREDFGKIKVVWLQGAPYEMGYQHGTLLHDEIASMGQEAIASLNFLGRGLALGRLARRRSFPDVVQECEGLAAATEDIGLTLDGCMVLALGDVYQEYLTYLIPNILFNDGCAHFVVSGDATADGQMYHGWTLDNNSEPIQYWIDHPTILVRQTNEGIPHVFITIPGVVWPNAGFNAEGIVVSNNTSYPLDYEDLSLQGKSTVQLMAQVAKQASTYEEAYAIMASHERMRSNLVIISDAKSSQAGVFELLGREMGVRELNQDGLLYMTNHFVSPEMVGRDTSTESSLTRFRSFQQLLEPDGSRSRYGEITPEVVVEILRDRTHPDTTEISPFEVFDDNASIGGNGSLRQVVFDPQRLRFWVAAGETPIPDNPFTCFSLSEMLGLPNAEPCPSPAIN
ncbi:MAG: C45 family autoproteolytic acyltransferase/hydrolase [Leptolyngbyaceae cyanobacterium MO_188.B28]|nr:C45 family autoproteolytic acyltransferase/hydrolase [Leptolyngbyaceae cyanobacterium MO_188.B28]